MGCEITRPDLALRCVCVGEQYTTAIRLETWGNSPTITESGMEVRLAAKHCQLTVYLLTVLFIASVYVINGRLNKQVCVCVVNYSIKKLNTNWQMINYFNFTSTFIYFETMVTNKMERFDKTENSSGREKDWTKTQLEKLVSEDKTSFSS